MRCQAPQQAARIKRYLQINWQCKASNIPIGPSSESPPKSPPLMDPREGLSQRTSAPSETDDYRRSRQRYIEIRTGASYVYVPEKPSVGGGKQTYGPAWLVIPEYSLWRMP